MQSCSQGLHGSPALPPFPPNPEVYHQRLARPVRGRGGARSAGVARSRGKTQGNAGGAEIVAGAAQPSPCERERYRDGARAPRDLQGFRGAA